jgi:hypothetical protein
VVLSESTKTVKALARAAPPVVCRISEAVTAARLPVRGKRGSLSETAPWATMQQFASALRRAYGPLIRQSAGRGRSLMIDGIVYVRSRAFGLGGYMRRIGRNSVGWGLEADAA